MNAKVINFTKNTITGNQTISGVGFTPLGYIMWSSGSTAASGSFAGPFSMSIAFCDGTNNKARVYHMDNRTGHTAVSSLSDNAVYLKTTATATVQAKATHSSFTSDGAIINWTVNDSSTVIISVLFIGGSDVTDFVVGDFGVKTSTGSQTVSTSIGSTPKLALFIPHGVTSMGSSLTTGGDIAFGGAVSSSSKFAWAIHNRNDDGTDHSDSIIYNSKCISRLDQSQTALVFDYEADFTAFTASGFTINVTNAPSVANLCSYLLISGSSTVNFSINNTTQKTSTGSQAFTGTGFQPVALMVTGTAQTSINASVETGSMDISIGAASAAAEAGAQAFSEVSASAQTTCSYCNTGKAYSTVAAATTATSSSVDGEASLTSLDSDGATINWSTSPGTADRIALIYFGQFVTPPPPPPPPPAGGGGLPVKIKGRMFG